ncbi:ABC transporter permease [Mucilaginibacter ginkgonis]|uniref:ABC transporter permease n=1 Tax=Mucilaginibacter ginkgonis TaxID=2682091 RepID=A0A6I4IMZ9_9SPHI|nr:ABC transporter permease [Mucilaginibacter ginkgonis]QQL51323.1 ABC transporter permease [Mucilaginibacter ginkgonis]
MNLINLKLAVRNISRNVTFSAVNILGLALGLSIFLLIAEYLAFEWNANRFHTNYQQLYRANLFTPAKEKGDYYLPPGLAGAISSRVPGVRQVVRMAEGLGSGVVVSADSDGGRVFTENNISYTDGNFFKVFSFSLASGSGDLSGAQTAAISATTAKKYFGTANAVGKTLTVKNQFGNTTYTVTTVYKDMPQQSDIKADILLSLKTLENPAFRNGNDWADPNTLGPRFCFNYVLLDKAADPDKIDKAATAVMAQVLPEKDRNDLKFRLQPFKYLHLADGFNYPFQTTGSLVMVVSFLVVALLIIVIAWVNYINLSTAQALQRIKDQGIRKILGASRFQVAGYHFTESFVFTAISCGIALLLVVVVQPFYNLFLEKELSLKILNQAWYGAAAISIVIAGYFLAAAYISLLTSAPNGLQAIKGKTGFVKGNVLKRVMVVFQFTISIILIIATVTLYRQLSFMQSQDLGMNIDQRLVITGPSVVNSEHKTASATFANELRHLPFVKMVAGSNNIPGQGYNFAADGITNLNPSPGDEKKSYAMLIVDGSYFETYGIKFKAGNNFSEQDINTGWSKAGKVILNEAAALQLGFNDPALAAGQKIKWGKDYEVVGVIKDYHHLSLHQSIQPMVFLPAVADGYFTIKVNSREMKAHISQLQALYRQTFPGEPFAYAFEDELYGRQYRSQEKLGTLFIAAAVAAIFIAALGLFGLAAFAAQQKVKEIGIRKVLGAGVVNIINLISADFIKLVALSVVIASPIAWFVMDKWLMDFAYRIHMQWWILALSGGIALLIALVTVSIRSFMAAMANPVTSLRNE